MGSEYFFRSIHDAAILSANLTPLYFLLGVITLIFNTFTWLLSDTIPDDYSWL